MANNRLWAVCIDDNECSCLAKSYGTWVGGFYCDDEFYMKHENCPSNQGCAENIVFVTEQDDPRVLKYNFGNSTNGTKTEIIIDKKMLLDVRKA